MTLLERFRRLDKRSWPLALACGSFLAAGCGGSDSTEPIETAQNSETPSGEHGASPTPAPDAHGTPAAAPAGAHGTPQPAQPSAAHGAAGATPPAAAHGTPPGSPADAAGTPPADAHNAAGSPGGAAGTPPAHGTPGTPMPAAHGAPAGSPATPHDAANAPPGAENPEMAAHGAPPGHHNSRDKPMPPIGSPAGPMGIDGTAEEEEMATQQGLGDVAAGHGAPGALGNPTATGEVPGPAFPGAMPGEGFAGEGVPGASQAPKKEFDEGTAEYAVQQLVLKMQAGETEGMSELISEKTGDKILAPLRDGEADQEQIEAAKELVANPQMLRSREAGSTMMFYVKSGENILTFSARREGESGDYRVNSLKVETPRNTRRR